MADPQKFTTGTGIAAFLEHCGVKAAFGVIPAWLLLLAFIFCTTTPASAQTYWLNSQNDDANEHYPTAQEACLEGELQRRLDDHQAGSSLQHRISTIYIGPESDIGERICQGVIQRRQFNLWLPLETVSALVYGPLGTAPQCLEGTADSDTGQCLIPKCNGGCPPDGGNPSNPIASASGHKRHTETDYQGAGIYPLSFTRTWSSHRAAAGRQSPLGTGWTHSYSARLAPILGSDAALTRIRVHRPNGAIQTFTLQGGQWQPDADVPERLTVTLDPVTGLLQSASYHRRDDSQESYNQHGRLTEIKNSDGHSHTLSYSGAQLHTITDPQGRSLQLAYNNTGQLTTLTSPSGTTTYSYSTLGRLTSVTHPDGTSRSYHWGETDHPGSSAHPAFLTGITQEAGQRIATWAYDAQKRGILSVHGPHNAATDRTTFQYNVGGSTTITDSLGQARTYQFSVSHGTARLAALDVPCDSCANTDKSKTYDANGYPQNSTDFDGNTTQLTFDANGRQTQKIQAHGTPNQCSIQTDWLPEQNKATEQRSYSADGTLLRQTSYIRNNRGQPLSITIADPATGQSRSTHYTYCDNITTGCPFIGLLKTSQNALGYTTQYSYHPENASHWRKGDLHTITNAAGHSTQYQKYDTSGRPQRIKDANGLTTDYQYHPRGWLTSITQSDGSNSRITTISYTPAGNVQSITQPDGSALHYAYDAIQRLIQIADNQGNHIDYTLDSAGKRTAEHIRDANNTLRHSLTRTYNLLGRVQTHTDAANASTHYEYSTQGLHQQTTDPLGRVTRYHYDSLQRLIDIVQDAGNIDSRTHHGYNALDQRIQIVDPKELSTHYQPNALGDLLIQKSPDTGTSQYEYDIAGNITFKSDANGHSAHTSRDSLHRPTSISYPGAPHLNVTYQYDTPPAVCAVNESHTIGQLTHMQDASGNTSWCYNRFGDLTRKVQDTEGTVLTLQYHYLPNGQLQYIQYPDGTLVDYLYDSTGRITEIGSAKTPQLRQIVVANIQYAPFGEPVQWQYGNGRTLSRTLDQNYHATAIVDSATDGLNIQYIHDAAGNITTLHANNATQALYYDGLNRLIANNDQEYSWDKTGNRLTFSDDNSSQNYDYPGNSHRLKSINSTIRQYDAAGNTTDIGANTNFHYGANNRLQSVQQGSLTTWYLYNGHGERVSRKSETDGSIIRSLYLEDGRWVGDYDYQAGQPIQQIIWLGDWPVAVLDHQTTAQPLHYIEPDHLGTPRVVIEQDRDVAVWTWPITGEAFGNTLPDEDPDGDGIFFELNMRFPGQRYDSASGLNYNYFRDYEAQTGRYTQSDPIGLAGGVATYSYAIGNPLISTDPRGEHKKDKWYGMNDRKFHRWFHRCWKQAGNPDASKEEIIEAYQYWRSIDSPDSDHCDGNPPPPPPAPTEEICEENCKMAVAVGLGAGGAAYLVYRCIRLAPSIIAPPLWPTLLPNLLTP